MRKYRRDHSLVRHQLVPFYRRKPFMIIVGVFSLIPPLLLARYIVADRIASVDPAVTLAPQEGGDSKSKSSKAATLPDDSEVFRTADRIREASALALCLTLHAITEQTRGRTVTAESLCSEIDSRKLLPPGVVRNGADTLQSKYGTLHVRFRRQPLGIEVLSFSKNTEDGPALMIRIPDDSPSGDAGSVFIADRLGHIAAPPAFAPLIECARAGWINTAISQTDITNEQKQQIQDWLNRRASQTR